MKFRRCICTSLLMATTTTVLAAGAIRVDFTDWDRSLWRPVREARFPQIVPFIQREDCIENTIPPGADEKDLIAAKDGIGVATMLLRDFCEADLTLRASMAFERKGAPAIIFRVQRQDDVAGDMYSLVLYAEGLNLWKFSGDKWSKVGASKLEVAPGDFHDVRLFARGGDFTVFLDGQKKLLCSDPQPLGSGEAGLWSGEGPCSFESFFTRPLALRK
jgi:hypothetical protein